MTKKKLHPLPQKQEKSQINKLNLHLKQLEKEAQKKAPKMLAEGK